MEYLFIIAILVLSIIIHEVSHGMMANYLGDPTAKYAGRLTLNPIKHIDPVGSIFIPGILILFGSGIIFGWAKPVPVNPYNFKDQKYGSAKVSFAGPLSNIIIALVFGLSFRFFPVGQNVKYEALNNFISFMSGGGISSMSEGFFSNMIFIFLVITYINLVLAIFNLIPIPPLDGSHILFTFLPYSMDYIRVFLNQYGMFILLFLVFFFLSPVFMFISFLFRTIIGI